MGHLAEDVERAALEDFLQAATPEIVTDLGIKCISTGSAFVSIASALPSSAIVINRAIGVGFPTAVTKDDVREIIEAYR